MSERPRRITDLRDLGAAFGLPPVTQATSEARESDFYKLSVLDKLTQCGRSNEKKKSKNQRHERLAHAVASALRMPKEEREAQGIRIVINGPLDEDGKLVTQGPDVINSDVIVVYPFGKTMRYLVTPDSLLRDCENVNPTVIETHVDEVHQEIDADHQRRLLFSIKEQDIRISEEKNYASTHRFGQRRAPIEQQVRYRNVTDRMERLNRKKTVHVWQFLNESLALESEHPGLRPLFLVEEDPRNSLLITLTMWHARDATILERALDPHVPAEIVDTYVGHKTNINKQQLERNYHAYLLSPETAPPHIRAGYETYRLLQDPQLWERQRGKPKKQQIFAKVVPEASSSNPKEIIPDLSSFDQLPLEEQLQEATKNRRKPSNSFERERNSRKKNIMIRNVLASSAEEREALGIDVVVVGPLMDDGSLFVEDAEHSQYQVYVFFTDTGDKQVLHAVRNSLANPLVAHAAVTRDELLQLDEQAKDEHLKGEDISDVYKRRLQELASVTRALDSVSFSQDPMKDVLFTELQGKKMNLLLSCLELAASLGQKRPKDTVFSCGVNQETNIAEWRFHSITHPGNKNYLTGETDERLYRFSRNPNRSKITFPLGTLQQLSADFERGEETEVTGAAVILLEKLSELGKLDE